jgi:replicative DNA helicase
MLTSSGDFAKKPVEQVFSTLNVIYNNGGTVNAVEGRRHLADYKLRTSLQGVPTNYPLIQPTPFKNQSLIIPT